MSKVLAISCSSTYPRCHRAGRQIGHQPINSNESREFTECRRTPMPIVTNDSARPAEQPDMPASGLSERIQELGEWFHNIDLIVVKTAPNHFLGDFPNIKWK